MSAPRIPYLDIPPLHLFGPLSLDVLGLQIPIGEISIKPFGALVAIGVFVGTELIKRYGDRSGLDARKLSSFVGHLLLWGFVGGHVFDTLFYHPAHLARSPLSLLRIWDGQSSFGGFLGAFIGLLIWRNRHQEETLPYADVVAACFPAGWVFGRSGCSLAHDHPGRLSDVWFAVAYPDGGRFDLGLYEMLWTIPLALSFIYLMKRPRPPGFFLGIMCAAYAPTRFALDFLRVPEGELNGADPRYAGLTPAQWGCVLLLLVGLFLANRAGRLAQTGRWHPPEPSDPVAA